MSIAEQVREQVYKGLVLDYSGNWVPIQSLVEQRRDKILHIENGEVLKDGKWKPLRLGQESEKEGTQSVAGNESETQKKSARNKKDTHISPPAFKKSAVQDNNIQNRTPIPPSGEGEILSVSDTIIITATVAENTVPVCLLTISGYVDSTNIHLLSQCFSNLKLQNYRDIIVHLKNLTYITSAGWGVLVDESKKLRQKNGQLLMVEPTTEVYDSFSLLNLEKVIEVHQTIEDCIETILQFHAASESPALGSDVPPQPIDETSEDNNLSNLPLHEKIKHIIGYHGILSFKRIKKKLEDPEYGKTKAGYIKLFRLFRGMNLDTEEKRMRFYRSW